MPSYGDHSPSLRKMDYNTNNNARFGGGSKFDFGNIIGDAFSLATVSIAIVGHTRGKRP